MELTNRCIVHIYKGEGKMLFVPIVQLENSHFFHPSEWYIKLSSEPENEEIGNSVRICINYLIDTPIIKCDSVEYQEKAPWRKESRYKSYNSFANHNELICITKNGDAMEITATVRTDKRGICYNPVEEIILPFNATDEDIGNAVNKAFEISNRQ